MSKWTEAELAMLREAYTEPTPDLIDLSQKTGRLQSNISRKARLLGLGTSYRRPKRCTSTMRMGRGMLTAEQEAWLQEHYNEYTNRELADRFLRSAHAIEKILRRLGLKKDYRRRGWTWRAGHPKGMFGKNHSEALKRATSVRAKECWRDPASPLNNPEHRQALSDRMARLQRSGRLNQGYTRCRGGRRPDLGGAYFRSSWEANYARYLNWLKDRGAIREWHYEKKTFDFPIKRGTRSYTPDFEITENDGSINYHEVKGWMTQRSRTALNRMRIYYPETKILLIAKKEYLAIAKWSAHFPGWES